LVGEGKMPYTKKDFLTAIKTALGVLDEVSREDQLNAIEEANKLLSVKFGEISYAVYREEGSPQSLLEVGK
jgi:hypothetical protein